MPFEWLNGKRISRRKLYRILVNSGVIPRNEKLERYFERMREIRAQIKEKIRAYQRARETETFEPTFEEMLSGKSVDQIKAERKERLEAEWKRREREVRSYGQ